MNNFFFSNNSPAKMSTAESTSTEAASYLSLESANPTIDNKSLTKTEVKLPDEQQRVGGQKRARNDQNPQQQQQQPQNNSFDSNTSLSQQQINEKKTTQGGRCRLFIGNVPSDLTQEEFQLLFGKYGELVEYFVNPSRGFGFIKLVGFMTI
jgi:RNA recognition motif-containing protein